MCRAQEQPQLWQNRREGLGSSSASTSSLQFAFPTLDPPPKTPHFRASLWLAPRKKQAGSARSRLGWRSWLLFASRIRAFWNSPGSDPRTAPTPSILLLRHQGLRRAARLRPATPDSWEEWIFIPLVVPAMAEQHGVPVPTSSLCRCRRAPAARDRDAFQLWLGPVGNQFAQTCSQLQSGAEQPLWRQHLVLWEGFAGPCLDCSVLEEAPECGEELG